MRVVVIGATGNHGTSLLRVLGADERIESILGVARRTPTIELPKTTWAAADVTTSELHPLVRDADAVVHLAWRIQPSRDLDALRRINVEGSRRVFRAAAEAGVPALVYASSIGAYSAGPKNRRVDESWPTDGIPSSWYSVQKSATERILDEIERDAPEMRVVRMRPALVFKGEAASEVRRLFTGPFLPSVLLHPRLIPIFPDVPRLVVQAVHSLDLADAYRLAVVRPVRGAFNVAAEPVLDPAAFARLLGARTVPVPARLVRRLTDVSWRARLHPTSPGWFDLGVGVPTMDTTRAREELGWTPARDAGAAFLELLEGLRKSQGYETPPLAPDAGGPLRLREILGGIGGSTR